MANEDRSTEMTAGERNESTFGFSPNRKVAKTKTKEEQENLTMTPGQKADNIDSTRKMRISEGSTEEK